jgi:nucleoid-associated protein YgaU
MDIHPTPTGAGIQTHIVVPGDTLATIARTYYGTPTEWQRIFNANRQHATGPALLRPGTEIVIPG